MAKSKAKPTTNTWEDDDFLAVITEIEQADDEAETIMASARGKVSGIRTRQKNRIKIAKQELQIPSDVLRAVLKQRKLERKLKALADSVSDDMVELYLDASNQFSFLRPEDGSPAKPAAHVAAEQRVAEIRETTDREQREGAEALDALTKVH